MSNMDTLKTALTDLAPFSEGELTMISERMTEIRIGRGEHLIDTGTTSQSFYYIISGSFRQYRTVDSGDEITLDLFADHEWMVDYKSFTSQKPAESITEANEDSIVMELTVWQLHHLAGISPKFFQIGRVLQKGLEAHELRTMANSPLEKYQQLMKIRPHLLQKFQLKHIASYLDITPETLSRVRQKITTIN